MHFIGGNICLQFIPTLTTYNLKITSYVFDTHSEPLNVRRWCWTP